MHDLKLALYWHINHHDTDYDVNGDSLGRSLARSTRQIYPPPDLHRLGVVE